MRPLWVVQVDIWESGTLEPSGIVIVAKLPTSNKWKCIPGNWNLHLKRFSFFFVVSTIDITKRAPFLDRGKKFSLHRLLRIIALTSFFFAASLYFGCLLWYGSAPAATSFRNAFWVVWLSDYIYVCHIIIICVIDGKRKEVRWMNGVSWIVGW